MARKIVKKELKIISNPQPNKSPWIGLQNKFNSQFGPGIRGGGGGTKLAESCHFNGLDKNLDLENSGASHSYCRTDEFC